MRSIRLAVAALSFAAAALPTRSDAYPIDCAILLCLAGGWPSAPECTAARAEFIRRITPWPVEPPLQIWRCPMGVNLAKPQNSPLARLYEISADQPPAPAPTEAREAMRALAERIAQAPRDIDADLVPVASEGTYSDESGTADIDISSPAFDFVRSIHVFDVDWYRRWKGGKDDEICITSESRVRLGAYGAQGDYSWSKMAVAKLPSWMLAKLDVPGSHNCTYQGRLRAIGIEWRDYAGNYSYELVEY